MCSSSRLHHDNNKKNTIKSSLIKNHEMFCKINKRSRKGIRRNYSKQHNRMIRIPERIGPYQRW